LSVGPFSETIPTCYRQLTYNQPGVSGNRQLTKVDVKKRGIFITLEGIDGTGKTTQHRRLVRYLGGLGYRVCATREPGGTPLGEQIRPFLQGHGRGRPRAARGGGEVASLGPLAELLLLYAARAQHLDEVVRPALGRGDIVVSDRFNDASFAYQGYGRKLGAATVRSVDRIVCGPTQPDLTLVLDLMPRTALRRARRRETRRNSRRSRFEAEGLKFQERVRAGYLAIARQESRRVKLVRADRPVAEVQTEIRRIVERFLGRRGAPRKAVGNKA
jgi:dTMP kinase